MPDVLPDDDNNGEEAKLDNDGPETDATITSEATPQLLASRDEPLRRKFLNCVAELLANKSGGNHVAAAALREGEDSVEIDIASNRPFTIKDDEYLTSLSRFLGEADTWETAPTDRTIHSVEGPPLKATVTRNANRLDEWVGSLSKLLGRVPALPALPRPACGAGLLNRCQENQRSATDAAQELVRRVKLFSSSTAAEKPAARLRIVRKVRKRSLMERRHGRLHPRSIRPPASMCQSDTGGSGRCKGCQSAWYCSEQCQSVDWPAHRLLCSSYLPFLQSRPSNLHKLGIWFPRNHKKPKLVWVPMKTNREGKLHRHHPQLGSFLGPPASKAFSVTTVTQNQRRGIPIGHNINIYHRQQQNHGPFVNNSLRHAAQACRGI